MYAEDGIQFHEVWIFNDNISKHSKHELNVLER